MSNLRLDESLIFNRVRLRAPSHLQAISQQQLYSLTDVPLAREEYLFLRKVSVKSSANTLSNTLQQTLLEQSDEAVDADSADAERAQAIKFNNLGQLLAKLTQDIQAGRQGLWYWQSWQHLFELPVGEALAQLWAEYSHHLTDMVQVLTQRGELDSVWLSFTTNEADKILLAVNRALNIKTVNTPVQVSQQPLPNLIKVSLSPWKTLAKKIDKQDSRLKLAAILLLLRWRPDYLLSYQAEQNITAVLKQLCDFDPTIVDISNEKANKASKYHHNLEQAETELEELNHADPRSGVESIGLSKKLSNISSGDTEGVQTNDDSSLALSAQQHKQTNLSHQQPEISRELLTKQQLPIDAIKTKKPSLIPIADEAEINSKEQINDHSRQKDLTHIEINKLPDSGSLYCQQGGIFYLLNFMARNNTQALLKQYQAYDQLHGPWGCLYRLAGLLDLQNDPVLEQFIAYRMGFKDSEEIETIPPLMHAEQYQRYAEKLYGLQVWTPQLLKVPAQIEYTASHLDIHYPLQEVKLEVRRVGLDVDPGWLVWLGQVVHFHYHENDFINGGLS